jgi:hypothetical protein
MNRNVLRTVVAAGAVVLGFLWLGGQPAVQGQKPDKAQQWEYKIYKATDADLANDKAETAFNKLAGEGWEFVETLVTRMKHEGAPLAGPTSPISGTTCVLFKRSKK